MLFLLKGFKGNLKQQQLAHYHFMNIVKQITDIINHENIDSHIHNYKNPCSFYN